MHYWQTIMHPSPVNVQEPHFLGKQLNIKLKKVTDFCLGNKPEQRNIHFYWESWGKIEQKVKKIILPLYLPEIVKVLKHPSGVHVSFWSIFNTVQSSISFLCSLVWQITKSRSIWLSGRKFDGFSEPGRIANLRPSLKGSFKQVRTSLKFSKTGLSLFSKGISGLKRLLLLACFHAAW